MIGEADLDHSGSITLEQFKSALQGHLGIDEDSNLMADSMRSTRGNDSVDQKTIPAKFDGLTVNTKEDR